MEGSYLYDDTTTTNLDSASLQYDTISTEILKDTMINNYLCKVVYNKGGLSQGLEYLTFLEDGCYAVAERSDDNNELYIFDNPILQYPSKMTIGSHWDESPDGKNRLYEVVNHAEISTQSGKFNCVKIKYNVFPNDGFFNVGDDIHEYISDKGLVKLSFSSSNSIRSEGMHGKVYWSIKIHRIN